MYSSGGRRPFGSRTLWIVAMVGLVVLALVVVIAIAAGVSASSSQAQLYDSIKIENLMTHLMVRL